MDILVYLDMVRFEAKERYRTYDQVRLAYSLGLIHPVGLGTLEAWLGQRLLALGRWLLALAGESETERAQPRLPSPT